MADRAKAMEDSSEPAWRATFVPDLIGATLGLLWDDSMVDTYNTHYKSYYTRAEMDAAYVASPARHW